MIRRVLVTGVGGNIGQGVVKALRAGSHEYFIVGTDMEPRSAGFSLVDRPYVTPAAAGSSEALVSRLSEIVNAESVEAIFVCSPAELTFFGAARRQLETETKVRVLMNPEPVVRVGQDKLETAIFLERHGFPSPETALATDHAAVDRLIAHWGFPVIAKPQRGFSSLHVLRLDSRAAVNAATILIPDLVVQQYLPGETAEYTAGVVGSAAARAFAWIVLRRDLLQGTTYRTELAQDPAFGAQIVAIAQALGVEGACNFQFRIVEERPVVFEINPRLSGTSGIRYLYGFNDPEMLFEHICLGKAIRQPAVNPCVVLRYWNEVSLPGLAFASIGGGSLPTGRPVALPPPRGAELAGP